MNLTKVFAAVLTVLGIAGLIYAAFLFLADTSDWKSLVVFGLLGLIFFSSGISLVKRVQDKG